MIYLDYAAATPVSKKARAAMEPYFSDLFFNPSAAYLPAKKVRADYEAAKSRIAHCIGAKGTDLVITASATEANNLAFTCLSAPSCHSERSEESHPQCLILETEHASVLNVAKNFPHALIKVDNTGTIILSDLKSKITDDVELISISLANNEIGTIQPLAEVSALIREVKMDRLKRGIKTPLYLHSDASQAMNLIDINVARLGVDLLTLNAAKVYGPKGIGALYVSHDVRLSPLIFGGGQELGLRSGTENVPGVIGFAAAFQDAKDHLTSNRKKYETFKKIFSANLNAKFLIFKNQLSNFCPIIFDGLDAERLIFKLEDRGIFVSTGAACAASKGEKSHTLAAIGLSDSEIAGSLRITFGAQTTEEDVKTAAAAIAQIVQDYPKF